MDKQKIYDEIQRIYEDSRMEARIAFWIANQIEPLLPKNWEANFIFGMWRGLLFACHSNHDGGDLVAEFKLVTKLVEQITNQKPIKEFWEYEGSITGLLANFHYPMANNHNLTISIRLFDTKECKTIIKKIKKRMIKQAELLDDCLG